MLDGTCDETDVRDGTGKVRTTQRYRIATTFDSETLLEMVKLDRSKLQPDRRRKENSTIWRISVGAHNDGLFRIETATKRGKWSFSL